MRKRAAAAVEPLGFVEFQLPTLVEKYDDEDVSDRPHDDQGDAEPTMGWPERCGQGPKIGLDASPLDFVYDSDDEDRMGIAFTGQLTPADVALVEAAKSMRRGRHQIIACNQKSQRSGRALGLHHLEGSCTRSHGPRRAISATICPCPSARAISAPSSPCASCAKRAH